MKREISKLEDHLGYWLRCLSNYVHHSFAGKLAEHNISVAQWVILRKLYDLKTISLGEAAIAIGLDKSSLSRLIEKLVKRGLVDRYGGTDRRTVKLSITDTGRDLIPKLIKLADENDDEFFKSFSVKQKIDLKNMLKDLLSANGWEQSSHGKDTME